MPIENMVKGISGNSALTGLLGGAAGGALVSAFTNKKTAGKLLKAGGLVAAGGLAWQAYQSYRGDSQAQPSITDNQSFSPAQNQGNVASTTATQSMPQAAPALARQEFIQAIESDEGKQVIIKAMIAAAHADGHLSDTEKENIWKAAIDNGASSTDLARLADEIANPWSVADLAAHSPAMETRIDVYTVSQLIIDESCDAGQAYLAALAQELALPQGLINALQNQASEIALAS